MNKVPDIEVGAQFNMRLSHVLTREVVRVSPRFYVIHDTSGTWVTARVSKNTLEKVMNQRLCLTKLNWR